MALIHKLSAADNLDPTAATCLPMQYSQYLKRQTTAAVVHVWVHFMQIASSTHVKSCVFRSLTFHIGSAVSSWQANSLYLKAAISQHPPEDLPMTAGLHFSKISFKILSASAWKPASTMSTALQ